jgi:hypothetical protein
MKGIRNFLVLMAIVSLVTAVGAPQAYAGDEPEYALPDEPFHKGDLRGQSGATDDDDGDPGDAGDGLQATDTANPIGSTEKLRSVTIVLDDLVFFVVQLVLLP